MNRAALLTCVLATVVVAGAGAAYRAMHDAPSAPRTGPDPVVITLPAQKLSPPMRDSLAVARAHMQHASIDDDEALAQLQKLTSDNGPRLAPP